MDLGTTGAILSFALELEKEIGDFYSMHHAGIQDTSIKELFETLRKAQMKRERILSRFRRENVTEMILEPIHGFRSEEFRLGISLKDSQDETNPVQTAIRIENNSREFFLKASEKTAFLPEVSEEFKRLADRADRHVALLKSIKR
jgi:rubrerythrin